MTPKELQTRVQDTVDERVDSGAEIGAQVANGSAAVPDTESGVAVAIMRNRFSAGDFDLATRVDTLVARSIGGLHHD